MTPKTENELAQHVAAAKAPLWIKGGGTTLTGEGDVLDVSGLSGITLYEPGALTMVAQAGTPLSEIEAALDAEGQMLAFEPPRTKGATIGGAFATNTSGARRVQVGAARDFLLGVRFVDGAGEIIKNGGRVMKNVTGYDLVKLMSGAHGTLGVLTEVSFKVLPKPEAQATIEVKGLTDAQATQAMSVAMGTPYDVSGAVFLVDKGTPTGRMSIRVEGFSGSVAHRSTALQNTLSAFGECSISETGPWDDLRGGALFSDTTDALWRVAVKPSEAAQFTSELAQTLPHSRAYDWAGGRVWIGADEADVMRAEAQDSPLNDKSGFEGFHSVLQEMAAQYKGHATLMTAPMPLSVPRFQPENNVVANLSAGLRKRFDPRGILNAGLMG